MYLTLLHSLCVCVCVLVCSVCVYLKKVNESYVTVLSSVGVIKICVRKERVCKTYVVVVTEFFWTAERHSK